MLTKYIMFLKGIVEMLGILFLGIKLNRKFLRFYRVLWVEEIIYTHQGITTVNARNRPVQMMAYQAKIHIVARFYFG